MTKNIVILITCSRKWQKQSWIIFPEDSHSTLESREVQTHRMAWYSTNSFHAVDKNQNQLEAFNLCHNECT